MAIMKLRNGETEVSDCDLEYLSQWDSWHIEKDGKGYVIRKVNGRSIFMHRVIMNTPEDLVCDHIDSNKLNNTRENLRNCTVAENTRNTTKQSNTSSIYKGVYWDVEKNLWAVQITFNHQTHTIGRFANEILAANAYNYYAKTYFGEFAKLNDCPYISNWQDYKALNIRKTSKYKGVGWAKREQRWRARVKDENKKEICLGYFKTEEEAANAIREYYKIKYIIGD